MKSHTVFTRATSKRATYGLPIPGTEVTMQRFDKRGKTLVETLRASLLMLVFGFGLLAYLIAIDRPHWFSLRPVSGTAAAMARAAQPTDRQHDARILEQPRGID